MAEPKGGEEAAILQRGEEAAILQAVRTGGEVVAATFEPKGGEAAKVTGARANVVAEVVSSVLSGGSMKGPQLHRSDARSPALEGPKEVAAGGILTPPVSVTPLPTLVVG